MNTTFANGPFTDASSKPFDGDTRDTRFDNQPPLEDRVMLEFEEELERDGIKQRIAELLESAERCPQAIDDETIAGKAGDLCKLARAVEQKISEAREKHNRPLLNAQRTLKGKADSIFAPLGDAVASVRQRLNAYAAKKQAEADAERRRLLEEERKAREALEEANVAPEVINTFVQAPPAVPKPVARGDYGSSVSGRTVWKHERQVPVGKLPKQILENEQVAAAVDKVIAQMVRSGCRELKGVRIYSVTEAAVR